MVLTTPFQHQSLLSCRRFAPGTKTKIWFRVWVVITIFSLWIHNIWLYFYIPIVVTCFYFFCFGFESFVNVSNVHNIICKFEKSHWSWLIHEIRLFWNWSESWLYYFLIFCICRFHLNSWTSLHIYKSIYWYLSIYQYKGDDRIFWGKM